MTRLRIAPPATLPIPLNEAKAHLRIDHDDEDDYLAELIEAATAKVEAETDRALIAQSWRIYMDNLPDEGVAELPIGPVLSLDKAVVHDDEGNPVVLDATQAWYDRHASPPRLHLAHLPVNPRRHNGLEFEVTAGYGAKPLDVPILLRRGVLMLVAHWHAFRGIATADEIAGMVPRSYVHLVGSFRRVRL